MPVSTLPAADALQQLDRFDAVIDARSESEFALDHLPGARNWPTLNDEERIEIGTLYKQVNAFEARKRGAARAARRIATHIEREVLDLPKGWRPLLYCWRGGQRSGSLATILGAIGFQVTLIEGGYKASRQAMVAAIPDLAHALSFRVLCGPTGSAKTRLLYALERQGAQVLDLEGLACHRSSVLGLIPGQQQPSQKHFDTRLWNALRRFDPTRPVYVESESKKVGNVRVADALMEAMRASPCIDLQLPTPQRVDLLMQDYRHFLEDPDWFCARLETLTELRGHAVVKEWTDRVRAGRSEHVVQDLLATHYDPVYASSIRRNFSAYGQALACPITDHHDSTLDAVAQHLITTG